MHGLVLLSLGRRHQRREGSRALGQLVLEFGQGDGVGDSPRGQGVLPAVGLDHRRELVAADALQKAEGVLHLGALVEAHVERSVELRSEAAPAVELWGADPDVDQHAVHEPAARFEALGLTPSHHIVRGEDLAHGGEGRVVHVKARVLLLQLTTHLDGLFVHVKGVELPRWSQGLEDFPGVAPAPEGPVHEHAVGEPSHPELLDALREHGRRVRALRLHGSGGGGHGDFDTSLAKLLQGTRQCLPAGLRRFEGDEPPNDAPRHGVPHQFWTGGFHLAATVEKGAHLVLGGVGRQVLEEDLEGWRQAGPLGRRQLGRAGRDNCLVGWVCPGTRGVGRVLRSTGRLGARRRCSFTLVFFLDFFGLLGPAPSFAIVAFDREGGLRGRATIRVGPFRAVLIFLGWRLAVAFRLLLRLGRLLPRTLSLDLATTGRRALCRAGVSAPLLPEFLGLVALPLGRLPLGDALPPELGRRLGLGALGGDLRQAPLVLRRGQGPLLLQRQVLPLGLRFLVVYFHHPPIKGLAYVWS
mmetsp:Transcript_64906/g.146421  ORF Transcript_64906/g.146421 Transcript_64906/m.146421 type:complete len:525 (-) Transcript_64906:44-1618(-)